ncbi:MATE family efflux transporter [Liberiplasma polymorphum]|uniref:MATE family efflux transporter n=1 Tax=Liberiplasma polymorphum TaxID=3374570 RepID=UPI003772F0F4
MQPQKNLFKLAWPIYIEFLFFMLMGVADTIMLSQYSDLSVAAVGNANRIVGLFMVLLNVVAIGVGIVVSQYVGAKLHGEAKNAIRAGLYSSALIALSLMIILQLFATRLFGFINTPETIFNDSLSYLRIVSMGLIFIAISQSISAGFKSHGHTKLMMGVVGTTNLLNVVLNFFLIFGIGFFPELGVLGAAISTLISKGVTLIIAFILLYKILGISPFFINFRPLKTYFFKILSIGFPSALEHFVYQLTQVVLLSFINTIGTVALTTQIYVFNLMMPVIVFSLAVAQGNQVMVGWHVGAGEYEEAYRRTLKTLKYSIGIVITVAVIMYLNAETLLGIFTSNQAIIEMGKRTMFIVIFIEIGRLSNLVVIQSLRASGDVIYPVIIAVISMLGVGISVAYLFGIRFEYGLAGIFIGLAADESLRGALVLYRWIKRDWIGKRITKMQTKTA